jgi:hypothetical protein
MKTLLLVAGIFLASFLNAQYYYLGPLNTGMNPGDINQDDAEYPFGGGLDPAWSVVLAPSGTPTWSAPQSLPFPFDLGGTVFNSFKVSNSGVLTFDVAAVSVPGFANAALPNAAIPDNSVCVWGLQSLAGSNDYCVQRTFGTAPNRQHWVFFSSYSTPGNSGWTYFSIVLEESTNKVYFVDQRNNVAVTSVNLTLGIQIDGTTAYQEINSPNVHPNSAASDPTRADNYYWEFIPGTQASEDVSLGSVLLPNYVQTPISLDIEVEVTNIGTQPVTSVQLSYTVNGSAPITQLISGLNIPSNGSQVLTHPTQWTPTMLGNNDIVVTAGLVNGLPDGDTTNNVSSKTVIVYDQAYPRQVLYETFTSSTCGPCTPGNANFEGVLSGVDTSEYTSVKFQQDFPPPGDPYATDESVNRRGYYAANSIPRLEIDGGWDGNSNAFTALQHNEAFLIPAFAELYAEYEIDVVNRSVKTCVDINSYADIIGKTLYIAVLEDTTYNNVATNGETEFYNVMKKMLPNESGQNVTVLANSSITVCETYTFNGSYRLPADGRPGSRINHLTEHSVEDFDHLKVAVWLQDDATLEVFNSHDGIRMPLGSVTGDGSLTTVDAFDVKLYPNPANHWVNLELSMEESAEISIEVYDAMGRVVERIQPQYVNAGVTDQIINTQSYNSGVYIVRITNGSEQITRFLTIQR